MNYVNIYNSEEEWVAKTPSQSTPTNSLATARLKYRSVIFNGVSYAVAITNSQRRIIRVCVNGREFTLLENKEAMQFADGLVRLTKKLAYITKWNVSGFVITHPELNPLVCVYDETIQRTATYSNLDISDSVMNMIKMTEDPITTITVGPNVYFLPIALLAVWKTPTKNGHYELYFAGV